ncbi:DNA polymerase IV [Cellulomonas chitinilytica]|uniref:DNA polymerase IV n=1 Tax=Cellulomonas chitinilytica TaxID=398759 RepID=A0A919P485_9CELL|nr:DNA polymerase IV [Cellulomonas chitinilytica]GIG23171.1 DNA polymerase IV [Cellulomonas chitinilytica]
MSRGPLSVAARDDPGGAEAGCSVLHVGLDAFFASVELARRPQLRGRPVVVGASHRGVVLAATDEARTFGVHPGMPMADALRVCPQAIVVPPDHAAYREVSSGVMAVLRDVTALVEQVSIDEAFLDVSGARRRLGPPTAIAARIRSRVRHEHGITCSVGIASTKTVAKLASEAARPDGVLLVPTAAAADFLRVLPVGALGGVDQRTEAALARRGVRTVAELADSDRATIQHAVGTVPGAHLFDLAWGRDPRPVDPDRDERSVGVQEAFDDDVADLSVVELTVLELADRCGARLRRLGRVARTVSVTVRTSDLRTLTRSRTLTTPTDVGREVYLVARELLAAADLDGLPVRVVGVRLEGLSAVSDLVRRPTQDEATDVPDRRSGDGRRPTNQAHGAFGGAAVRAGAERVGRGDGSTTTIVPSDLS